jgi:Fic family protein
LENSIRNSEQINTKTPCPSKKVPKNIEKLQEKFPGDQLKKEWYSLLSSLKKSYAEKIGSMPQSVREKEVRAFSTRFTYGTGRIEESKLTLSETATLLKKGIAPEGRRFWQWGITPLQDIREARAQEKLFYEVLECKKDLSFQMVLDWHKKLFQTTKPHIAGKVRKHQISIFDSKFIPPSAVDIHSLLREFFRWYHGNQNRLHPVELAAVAHLKFVTIHPFVDGNGRIARLMINFMLHRNGYPMFNIP